MKTVNDYEPFITVCCRPTTLFLYSLSPLLTLFFTLLVFYVHITVHLALMRHSRLPFMALPPRRRRSQRYI